MILRKLAPVAALVAATALLCVMLAEGALRTYARVADSGLAEALRIDPYDVLVEPHGQRGYRPRSDHVIRYENGAVANINSMGFRGPTVAVPKPAGTYRIVLLGGSTTFGWHVDDDETIARQMSRMLRERYPDVVTEVVNLAFDGYDSYQLLERLRSDGIALEPDALIINAGVNDVAHAWYRDIQDGDARTLLYRATLEQLRHEEARGGPTPWTRTKHWLYVARVPGWLREQAIVAVSRKVTEDRPPATYWDVLDYFQRNLERLVELGSDAGSVVLLSTPPSSLRTLYDPDDPPIRHYWIRDAQTTQAYRDSLDLRMRAVVEGAAEGGRAVAYVQHQALSTNFFLDDAHLTPEGNGSVAEDFVRALDPWLREFRSGALDQL